MPHKKDGTVMRATLSVTLIVLISKAVGFVRDAVNTYYFGKSAASDAYYAAYGIYYIPILLFTSCITSTLIPMYLNARRNEGQLSADRFGSNVINLSALAAMALSILMYALAGPITRLVYMGFDQERMSMTIEMTRIMMPSLMFVTISIAQSSIMNASEKYFAGQLSGFPYSIVTILMMALFARSWGINALAWGTAIAGVLQVLVILPFQRGVFKYRFCFDVSDKRVRRMILLAAPSMASMAVVELSNMFDKFMASGLSQGDMTGLTLGWKLVTLILGVVTVPIITVMFSRMSKHAAENDKQAIIDIVMQCIEVICLILLPIMAVAGVLATDVFHVLFVRGAFDIVAAQTTAAIFVMYLLGVIFYGIKDLLNRAFHSIQNTRVPLYTSLLQLTLNIIGNLILSRYLGAAGLALSTSISCAIATVLQFYLLRGKLGKMRYLETLIEVMKSLVAAALCTLLAMALNHYVPEQTGTLFVLLRLMLCGIPPLLLYVEALALMKARQLSFLKSMIHRQ